MKTKSIFALLTALLLSAFSIQAAGLIDESNLLLGPAKKCTPRKAAGRPAAKATPEVKVAAAGEVLVKLFNADGELVCLQSVTMAEFMSGRLYPELPAGGHHLRDVPRPHCVLPNHTDGAATPGA
jgi:hypothetical protein